MVKTPVADAIFSACAATCDAHKEAEYVRTPCRNAFEAKGRSPASSLLKNGMGISPPWRCLARLCVVG